MRSHNSGNIHSKNLHILAAERKELFLESQNKFLQKNYFAYRFENKGFYKRNILINSDILLVIAVGHYLN